MSEQDQLRRELEQLAARLAAVERLLNLRPPAAAPVPPPAAPISPPPMPVFQEPAVIIPPPVPATEDLDGLEPAVPVAIQSPPEKSEVLHRLAGAEAAIPSAAPPTAPPPISQAVPPPIPPHRPGPTQSPSDALLDRPARSISWELLIGGKAMAWIGALAVLLGAAFAVAVGVQRGWWGHLPPSARCIGIALAGGAMLLCGEVALRRIGRAASAGLFGAGLGTLYLDAFATFKFFNLLEAQWAFVLMGVVAVIGFSITLRTRFMSIGILSIIGGYLTPPLLAGNGGHDLELLGYLTMLLAISLGLSALVPRSFRPLRYVALGAHVALAMVWLLFNASQWSLAIVFLSIWWAMTLVESVYAAQRRQSAIGNVVAVVQVTALYVTAGCWVLNGGTAAIAAWLGAFALGIGLLSGATAILFGPGLDALRNAPVTPMEKLAVALWAQGGVLLAAAIALQFDGFGQSVGWLAMGLAAVEIGRRLPSRGVTIFGLLVGALALARIWAFDWWTGSMRTTLWTRGDIEISRWSLLALGAVLAAHIAAQRIRVRPHIARPWSPVILAALGTIQWLVLTAICCEHLAQTGAWLLGAIILLALEPWGRRQRYFELALMALSVTAARWLIVDAVASRMSPGWSATDSLPLLNGQMGMSLAIAAVAWWAYRILRKRQRAESAADWMAMDSRRSGWQWVLIFAIVFGLVALSFEVDHAVVRIAGRTSNLWWSVSHVRQLLLTLLWALGSLGIGLLTRAIQRGDDSRASLAPVILIRFAWLILSMCAVKWIVADTLMFALFGTRPQVIGSLPLANVQMLVGLSLAVCSIVLRGATRTPSPAETAHGEDEPFFQLPLHRPAVLVPIAAWAMVLWGLTFEVDRILGRIAEPVPHWLAAWPALQLRGLLWTALWALGAMSMMLLGHLRRLNVMLAAGWHMLAITALAWLTGDTLLFRLQEDAVGVRVILNVQFLVGALVAALLILATIVLRAESAAPGERRRADLRRACGISLGLLAAIGLLLGSLEIDRWFSPDWSGVQTGLSVYWGIYGVMLVLVGFGRRASLARYAGLALLGITILKALVFDMKNVDLVWRALIFVVVGLLFIGVSVIYAKVAPRMFGAKDDRGPNP